MEPFLTQELRLSVKVIALQPLQIPATGKLRASRRVEVATLQQVKQQGSSTTLEM